MTDTIKDLIDRRGALRGLLLHPGWQVLCDSAAEERALILRVFAIPLKDLSEVPAQEFSKGRAYQLDQLSSAPLALIDNLTTEIQSIQQENPDERQPDATAGTDDPLEHPFDHGAERAP